MCSYGDRCVYCNKKIFLCKKCGAVDDELTTDCSRVVLNHWFKQAISFGGLDFIDGEWIIKDKLNTIR